MLSMLRSAAGTWVAKLLLILLVLSFAVWGISGQILGGSNHVVAAGDTRVSAMDYRLAYDRQIAVLSQQFGTRITREQAVAMGLDQQVLGQLVAGALLDEQAREMELGVSRDRLAALTAEDPAFQGPDGRFDRGQFGYVLSQIGMRPEDYLRNREQVAVRQQIVEAVADGLTMPDAFLRAVSIYRGEDRTVDLLVLPPSLAQPIEDPEEAELAAYFEENGQAYAAPEYRTITYVKLEPADIADPAAIGTEAARTYYDANTGRFGTAEQRTIEQLVFPNREAADAALQAIRDGQSFEDTVAAAGRTMADVRLGTYERESLTDEAIAEAAFSLDESAVSDVLEGPFGPRIIRVTEILPAETQAFEEVEQQIREELALDEANTIILDVFDAYEDARAGGSTMEEAATEQGLEMITVEAVDRTGRTPEGEILDDLPASRDLLAQAFDTEAGIENPPLDLGSVGYLFYEVTDIIQARDRTLDEVREQVVRDWKGDQTATRLAALAAEAEQAVEDGTPLDEIASGHGLQVQTRRGLSRDSDDGDLGQAGVAAVFGVPQGGIGVVGTEDGNQIVFRVTEVIQPADAGPQAVEANMRQAFASGLSEDLLNQIVARLQTQYEVTVNQSAMQQAMNF